MGRPSEYNEQTATEICRRLMDGESLRKICRDDAMPVQSTVFKWLAQNDDFAKQYAHARETQADTLADEIVDISDNGDEDVQRDRLRVDARKWIASKLKPKKYGDKAILAGDEDNPVRIEAGPSLEEAARRIAFTLSAALKQG